MKKETRVTHHPKVEFPPGWGAPGKVTLNTLCSWTEHADKGVKYFSGTAAYRKAFAADPMLLKRPVVERDGEPVLVGFRGSDDALAAVLA